MSKVWTRLVSTFKKKSRPVSPRLLLGDPPAEQGLEPASDVTILDPGDLDDYTPDDDEVDDETV